jgi:cell division septum initiation protein DivIVA
VKNRFVAADRKIRDIFRKERGNLMGEYTFNTEIKGYNKEEVESYILRLEKEYENKIMALEDKNRIQSQMVEELKRRVAMKEKQRERLEQEIETKYKKYIDNYDKIAGLVYDSKVKADKVMLDAHEKEQEVLHAADEEARARVESVREQIEKMIADGKKRYKEIQDQVIALGATMNEAQNRFREGYKNVHNVLSTMPEDIGLDDHPDFLDSYDTGIEFEEFEEEEISFEDFDIDSITSEGLR